MQITKKCKISSIYSLVIVYMKCRGYFTSFIFHSSSPVQILSTSIHTSFLMSPVLHTVWDWFLLERCVCVWGKDYSMRNRTVFRTWVFSHTYRHGRLRNTLNTSFVGFSSSSSTHRIKYSSPRLLHYAWLFWKADTFLPPWEGKLNYAIVLFVQKCQGNTPVSLPQKCWSWFLF